MRKKNNRGLTVTEVLVALAIVAMLAAAVVPSMLGYVRLSQERKLNNTARTIYLAAQNRLSDMQSSGALEELALFDVFGGTGEMKGGYLENETATSGKLPAELTGEQDEANEPYLYYITMALDGEDDEHLLRMLENYVDPLLLSESISVEFNALTGKIKAVFYSEKIENFRYDGAEDESNLLFARNSSHLKGVYQVDTTGKAQDYLPPMDVNLYDDMADSATGDFTVGVKNALCVEAVLRNDQEEEDQTYTIDLLDAAGNRLPDAAENKNLSLTFDPQGITASSLEQAIAEPYEDLEQDTHGAGVLIEGKHHHTVFKTSILDGSYTKVTWVLDYLDPDYALGGFLPNSIQHYYPSITVQDISARFYNNKASATVYQSMRRNAYFHFVNIGDPATADDDQYLLENARHLNNIRYLTQDARSFIQARDINASDIINFAPLTWVPNAAHSTIDMTMGFRGTYNGSGYRLGGLRISAHAPKKDVGLFGILDGGKVQSVQLESSEIIATEGGNVGGLAGLAKNGAEITQCKVEANVLCMGDGETANVGGIVGMLSGGTAPSRLHLSYTAGFFYPGNTVADADKEGAEIHYDLAYHVPEMGIMDSTSRESGSVIVDGNYRDDVALGGVVGNVEEGCLLDSCYNNARVNILASKFSEEGEDAYLSTEPELMPALTHATDIRRVCIGGVAGRNGGQITGVYNTNFIGTYKVGSRRSSSAAIVGLNGPTGSCTNSMALLGNVALALGGSNQNTNSIIVSKEDLAAAAAALTPAFAATTPASDDPAEQLNSENYPYPAIKGNPHNSDWENIKSVPIERDLSWVEVKSATDPFSANYKEIQITTADSFYEYNATQMQLSFSYDKTKLEIDTSNKLLEGASSTSQGNQVTITLYIQPGALYKVRFYAIPNLEPLSDEDTVTVRRFVGKPQNNPFLLQDSDVSDPV